MAYFGLLYVLMQLRYVCLQYIIPCQISHEDLIKKINDKGEYKFYEDFSKTSLCVS